MAAAVNMVGVDSIEQLAQSLCFTSAILFALIATFSRSEKAESMAQNAIAILLVSSAAVLWWLSLSGGELWGSNYLPKPLSLICLILAFSARMNIKGKNISFGANPHNINKKDQSDDSEE